MTDTVTPASDKREFTHARDLKPGDRIAAGFLPSLEPSDVLFAVTYRLSANRDPWVLVVFRADGADPDDMHFVADALIPVEVDEAKTAAAEAAQLEQWRLNNRVVVGEDRDRVACDEEDAYRERAARLTDPTGLGYSREADDPTPVSPARRPLQVAPTLSHIAVDGHKLDEDTEPVVQLEPSGLTKAADESRGALAGTTPVVTYFSFGHGQTDPDTGKSLLDHYVTVVAPTYEGCREAMFASRFGNRWSFDYLAGTARATGWVSRWTEHEVIVAPGTDKALAGSALTAARDVLTGEEPVTENKAWVHYRASLTVDTACGEMVADLPWPDGTSANWAEVTCKPCLDQAPF